ncbi:uncharacterized protein LOC130451451 [Diorhabda sublineata]|uniref:uncharacterized protein LOC130451451 n=1 Tax=Diorhabda sublineata TaxID=1163346 RepID=UPI0024E07D45|nr:uncharacterized protein LOC130451451 [Diorhabda sublineata]
MIKSENSSSFIPFLHRIHTQLRKALEIVTSKPKMYKYECSLNECLEHLKAEMQELVKIAKRHPDYETCESIVICRPKKIYRHEPSIYERLERIKKDLNELLKIVTRNKDFKVQMSLAELFFIIEFDIERVFNNIFGR